MKRLLIITMLVGSMVSRLGAAVHPALPPSADSGSCVTCHRDLTKGAFVHAPMTKGCLTCHEVRVTNNVTRVRLVTTNPLSLCLTCHADKNASLLKGNVHSPAVRDCLRCHNPHRAENKNLLVMSTSGATPQNNLCLTCHNTGVDVPDGGSRHAALDKGCETCHITHKVGNPAQREFASHLTKDSPQLCLDCHAASDAAMLKAHQNQSVANSDCLKCHDPHASKAPHLLLVALPAKVEPIITQVTAEHPYIDPKQIKTETCIKCHPDKSQGKYVHTAVGQGCDNCHTAASDKGKTTITDVATGGDLCAMCHEAQKASVLHGPYKEGQCLVCHDPHTSNYPKQLRASVNDLCLVCHGPEAERTIVDNPPAAAVFGGKVKLPIAYLDRVPVLPLRNGRGHPVEGHPISDVVIPKTKANFAMNCLSCHQPHGGNAVAMLVKDQQNNMQFCKTCHVNELDLTDVRAGGNPDGKK
jgi:predicted CXXCH cytochrome family protein